jgi:hypothetical protein
MHCIVKKTLELIKDSGNDFLIKVKGNTRKLLRAVKQIVETTKVISSITKTVAKQKFIYQHLKYRKNGRI